MKYKISENQVRSGREGVDPPGTRVHRGVWSYNPQTKRIKTPYHSGTWKVEMALTKEEYDKLHP